MALNMMTRTPSARVASAPRLQRHTVLTRSAITAERATLDISKMEPIHDRVLVKPMEEEEKTQGGILLPKSAPKAPSDAHFGEVISVGADVKLSLKPGDMIVFQKYAMAEVEVKDGNILFVAEKSIMGKLE